MRTYKFRKRNCKPRRFSAEKKADLHYANVTMKKWKYIAEKTTPSLAIMKSWSSSSKYEREATRNIGWSRVVAAPARPLLLPSEACFALNQRCKIMRFTFRDSLALEEKTFRDSGTFRDSPALEEEKNEGPNEAHERAALMEPQIASARSVSKRLSERRKRISLKHFDQPPICNQIKFKIACSSICSISTTFRSWIQERQIGLATVYAENVPFLLWGRLPCPQAQEMVLRFRDIFSNVLANA